MNINSQVSYDQSLYLKGYNEISRMLENPSERDFKRAVFIVENAFYNGEKDYKAFNSKVRSLASMAYSFSNQVDLIYEGIDSTNIRTHTGIWAIMTDTLTFDMGSGVSLVSKPYTYDFEDVFGRQNWSQMFVTKLLDTRKGNCHSLPYLYKILAEELGETAHLALAPNHIYIKNYSQKTGWYNTELTSASFPIDAWLMASGYIHMDAIRNEIYMDTLSQRESLALTLLDLAQGYERKFGIQDASFILKATDKALEVNPSFINALLLKAETQKKLFENQMLLKGLDDPNVFMEQNPEAKKLFLEMQGIYTRIHQLGYRQMPEEMYLDWLITMEKEKEKYQNDSVSFDR